MVAVRPCEEADHPRTAARDDERLLRFYESLGGKQHPEKVFFRLTGEGLARFAEG